MTKRFIGMTRASLLLVGVGSCRGEDPKPSSASDRSLPPALSLGPVSSTNWDPSAGAVMLIGLSDKGDSAAVVLPEVTDSAMETLVDVVPPISAISFDLYG